ncbi:MAG: nucleotidyl transferase [Candidatus Melainabacteria bacterium HGW-Melainabacteria-1]|nr:MAG: nucleotidyl transferase [Candidatus Melainabacteria bacterium HGW-Melainabacteria-1]
MKAVILAAGRGSRMKGLTDEQPKCLTQLAGRSLLDWQLSSLGAAGVSEVAVVRGYRGEWLERPGLTPFENPRWAATNMVMSLTCAADWLSQHSCLISYGDIVYPPEAVQTLIGATGDLLICYDLNWLKLWQARFADPLSDAESFASDTAGRLLDIGRKVTDLAEIQGQYMGLLRFTPRGWSQISAHLADLPAAERDRLDMTTLLRQLLAKGIQIGTLAIHGGWLEVDSQDDLAAAQALIAQDPAYTWLRQHPEASTEV